MSNKIEIDLEQITSELDAYKVEKARLSFELKQVEKEIEKREMQLTALLEQMDVKQMDYGVYTFGFKEVTRTAFDQKAFKEAEPEMFAKYYVPKSSEKFEFNINK